jgi:glycogen debranching enzyme
MHQAKGRSNADSLFGMGDIPCDNQIRTLLDPVAPAQLFSVCAMTYAAYHQGTVWPWLMVHYLDARR